MDRRTDRQTDRRTGDSIYRVGQIKWQHFTFSFVTHECIHKILWFLPHINYIMQKMRRCYVYVIMSTLVRQRALQKWVLSICISTLADLLSLNFFTLNSAFFLHSLLKFYSKQKFVWFCYLVVFIKALYFFANSYLFHLVLLLKITVQYRSLRWEKSHEIVIKMLRVEKVGTLSERICWLKLVQIELRSTHQKRGLCWITNRQFYWSRSYVRLSLKILSQYETYTWGYTWRPLACNAFINIKLAAHHLLLYVVYLCQKIIKFRLCINLLQAKM